RYRAAIHEHRPGVPKRLGRRPEPQQHGRDALRRLHRSVLLVYERRLCRAERGVRAGDQERALGRRHVREHQVLEQHPQLRRLLHVWSPGAYLPDRGEGDLVHPNIGVEKYFFFAGDRILNRIKEIRNTAIFPERTGPISDVLYSAAGNSADEHWYNRDVIAYSFETGADRYVNTTLAVASAAGATAIRAANR